MGQDALQQFTEAVSASWGPLTSELAALVHQRMATLCATPPSEQWLSTLVEAGPDSRELYRDPAYGFLLLGHTERAGLYRPPHDHGRGWVAYAVLRGEMEMRTYGRIHDLRGQAHLIRRETFPLRAGDVRVFLPGDIHDTRCTEGPLTLFRFTSRDLQKEELTRYPEPPQEARGT